MLLQKIQNTANGKRKTLFDRGFQRVRPAGTVFYAVDSLIDPDADVVGLALLQALDDFPVVLPGDRVICIQLQLFSVRLYGESRLDGF